MKKLIFLLILAVAFASFISALDTAHPPGVLTLEAALYGDSADSCAVSPYAVLATLPVMAEPTSFQAVMALYNYEEIAIKPQSGAIPVIDTDQFLKKSAAETLAKKAIAENDYPLLC